MCFLIAQFRRRCRVCAIPLSLNNLQVACRSEKERRGRASGPSIPGGLELAAIAAAGASTTSACTSVRILFAWTNAFPCKRGSFGALILKYISPSAVSRIFGTLVVQEQAWELRFRFGTL